MMQLRFEKFRVGNRLSEVAEKSMPRSACRWALGTNETYFKVEQFKFSLLKCSKLKWTAASCRIKLNCRQDSWNQKVEIRF